jgi:hypothetical protein
VILVDVNLLIYAHVSTLPQHKTAREWLDGQLSGFEAVGLPWASLLGFIRIITNPRLFAPTESASDAWRQVQSWLSRECAWTPQPTDRHAEVLGRFLALPGMRSKLVPDAHLAALAVEHGLTLCSSDGDFARFPGLRWSNPLAA